MTLRVLLPFFDDSTLIFASAIKPMLEAHGFDVITLLETEHQSEVSQRQLTQLLPVGPDLTSSTSIYADAMMASFDALITCKAPRDLRYQLSSPSYRRRRDRPAYVAFQPGLEFTPDRGRKNRIHFDIVFLNNTDHRDRFKQEVVSSEWQHVTFGHPYFIKPSHDKTANRENIYFFAQAICPLTLHSRRFTLDILVTLARRYPDRKVFLKLRHLPGENGNHVHREQFDYPWLLNRYFKDVPTNLEFTACTMAEALSDAGYAITCTSTAAMDSISKGIPTFVYVDYPENYLDPYSEPMRREFEGSDLLASIPSIMELDARPPSEEWLASRFRDDTLFDELKAAIVAFKTKSQVSF